MSPRFVQIDRQTPMLLPPDVQDWVASDHLARFIVEAVDELDLRMARVNERGTGDAQYPPGMMFSLLIFSYATGTFSSRQIERASKEHLPTRFICANTYPDHDTICTFRRQNNELFQQTFRQVLELAEKMKIIKFGQITIAHDGTKIQADASKHSAVSYERAGEMVAQLELEIKQLVTKAEAADSTPLQEGLSIPEEIARREVRKGQLQKARQEIEKRARERAQAQQPEYEQKVAQRQAQREQGQKVRGPEPKAPSQVPESKDQYNFTDPESRIMKAGNGAHFQQAYNAQASVEVTSRLIVGQSVTEQANDKQQLAGAVATVQENVGSVKAALVDSGYYSEEAVQRVETNDQNQPTGTTVYAAVNKLSHHRTVEDLEKKAEPAAPGPEAGVKEIMQHRLKTEEGKALYDLRKETVEPIFGIIKETMGFRRFSMRGKAKAALEWTVVTLSYNLRRMHRVQQQRENPVLVNRTNCGAGKMASRGVWMGGLRVRRLWAHLASSLGETTVGCFMAIRRRLLPIPSRASITTIRFLSPTGC